MAKGQRLPSHLNRNYLGLRSFCHPRESGDPEDFSTFPDFLDSRFLGNDARKLRFPYWLRFKDGLGKKVFTCLVGGGKGIRD